MLFILSLLFVSISPTSGVTICSSSSILSTFTDPLCTSWCKVRLCSSGTCKSVLSGDEPTCQCESCTFGNWFGSSSDSNSNPPVTGQYYQAGSGGATINQNNRNNYDTGYGNNNRYSNDGYNTGYRTATAGYGNANANFNSNQQYAQYPYNTNYGGNQGNV